MKPTVIGLLALGAAGVGATLYLTSTPPAAPTTAAPGAVSPTTLARNSDPGRLPSIHIGDAPANTAGTAALGDPANGQSPTTTSSPSAVTDARDPQVAALQQRLADLELRLATAGVPPRSLPASLPAAAANLPPEALANLPPSKPPPTILPGTANSPDGPIFYDPNPPWPFNQGLRGADPPHVAGAGCGTCESGTQK